MWNRPRILFLAAMLAVVTGCQAGPSEEREELPPLTLETYPSRAAVTVCEKLFSCCNREELREATVAALEGVPSSVEDCEERATAHFETTLSEFDSETVEFDVTAATACLQGLNEATCTDVSVEVLPFPCSRRALMSSGPEGTACEWDEQCEEGLQCVGATAEESGDCKPLRSEGATCGAEEGRCATGLRCALESESPTCQPQSNEGEECTTHDQCLSGLCDESVCSKREAAPVGAGCFSNDDCATGICERRACVSQRSCDGVDPEEQVEQVSPPVYGEQCHPSEECVSSSCTEVSWSASMNCLDLCDPAQDGAWSGCGEHPCVPELRVSPLFGTVELLGGFCGRPGGDLAEGERCERHACGVGLLCESISGKFQLPLLDAEGEDIQNTCRRWCRPSEDESGCSAEQICHPYPWNQLGLPEYDLGICVVPLETGSDCSGNQRPCREGPCVSLSNDTPTCRVYCDPAAPDCPNGEECVEVTNMDEGVCVPSE